MYILQQPCIKIHTKLYLTCLDCYFLSGSYIKEYHSEQYEQHINSLAAKILFLEHRRSTEEANNNAASTDHRHDANHSSRKTKGVEINKVGYAKEDTYENDAPAPLKLCGLIACGPPDKKHCQTHHKKLIDIIPTLHNHHCRVVP